MKNLKILLVLILTISRLSFAQNCIFPEITSVTGSGTYCYGEEVTLTLSGTLNNAVNWQWYSDICGGTEVENGTNAFITITIKSDTTFFVRGVGGCVANRASCTEVVLKLEDEAPVVTCAEDIVVENEEGVCFTVVEYELPTGTDNCSEVVVTQIEGFGSGSQFPVGVTNEIFEITDSAGNTSICSISITVFDTENPIILCPVDISAFNDPGECGAIVAYETPSGTDNCPGSEIEITEGLGSGSFFPVGSTTETYTITDAAGNTSTCSFIVTVEDNEPPIITVNDKLTVLWPPNHKHHTIAIDEYIESVTDNCPGITIDDVIIDKVSSDEMQNEKGDGNTLDDIVISDDCKSVQLLAERQGG